MTPPTGSGSGEHPPVVPGSSFYSEPELGHARVRFAFCKRLDTLEEAGRRLRRLGHTAD